MSLYERIKAARQHDPSVAENAEKMAAMAQEVVDSVRRSVVEEQRTLESGAKLRRAQSVTEWIRGTLTLLIAAVIVVAVVFIGIGGEWLKTGQLKSIVAGASTPVNGPDIAAASNSIDSSGISSPIPGPTDVSVVASTSIPTSVPTVLANPLTFVEPKEVFMPVVDLVLDGNGVVKGQFDQPQDVAIDSHGVIYVADTGNHRVQKIDANGRYLIYWGQNGPGEGPYDLIEPVAIVVDRNDRILVLDSVTGWVKCYNSEGEFLGQWAGPGAKIFHPRGMLVDFNGNVWIADTGNSRLLEYAPDGQIMLEMGLSVEGTADRREPVALAMDAQSNLYVADSASHQIVKLDSNQKTIASWPIPSTASFFGSHLVVTADQSLLVTDPESNRLLEYSLDGQLRRAWGSGGTGIGQFSKPGGIEVQGAKVYVADTSNNRLQILRSK